MTNISPLFAKLFKYLFNHLFHHRNSNSLAFCILRNNVRMQIFQRCLCVLRGGEAGWTKAAAAACFYVISKCHYYTTHELTVGSESHI